MRLRPVEFLILAVLILSSFTTLGQVSVKSPISTNIQNGSTNHKVADGTVETIIVNVTEDESVAESYPDLNLDSNTANGGLFVGWEPIDGLTRSWLKFDLSYLPTDIAISAASLRVYMVNEYLSQNDTAIGAYYSENDTWAETTITWNTQPDFALDPSSIIDSPASPNMFVPATWYSWDITGDVIDTLTTDGVLSEVLRQVNETPVEITWKYFCEKDYDVTLGAYVAIEYTTPTTDALTVDEASTYPFIDYIQDATPELGWMMSDPDLSEYQKDYDLEVSPDPYFNDTLLLSDYHSNEQIVYSSGSNLNYRPFGTAAEMRFQFKYDYTLLPQSGYVDKLLFNVDSTLEGIEYENLIVTMASTSNGSDLTSDFEANFDSAARVVVLRRDFYTANIINGQLIIDVENTFNLNHALNLIIELRFTGCSDDTTTSYYTYVSNGSVAYSYGPGAYTSTTAIYLYNRVHNLMIDFATDSVYKSTATSENAYPFAVDTGTSGIFQIKYNRSMIDNEGFIDKISFRSISGPGSVVYHNLRIYLVETPVEGQIYTDFEGNYGGVEPTLVLDAETFVVHNINNLLTIDVDDVFYYHNEHDLLIDFRFDTLVSGFEPVVRAVDAGAYRAYNMTFLGSPGIGQDTRTYDMGIDFVYPTNQIEYTGYPLENNTDYFWRVRTCDSVGIWSDWAEGTFGYRVISTIPTWQDLSVSPEPVIQDESVTVSINVTHLLGIDQVLIEFDGTNHTMTAIGNIFFYSWTPHTAGILSYTIYMRSAIDTWNSMSESFEVEAPPTSTTTTSAPPVTSTTTPSASPSISTTMTSTTPTSSTGPTSISPADYTTIIIIIVAGAAVIIVIIIIVMKKRS